MPLIKISFEQNRAIALIAFLEAKNYIEKSDINRGIILKRIELLWNEIEKCIGLNKLLKIYNTKEYIDLLEFYKNKLEEDQSTEEFLVKGIDQE